MNRPRVLLADDHRVVAEGLKHVLGVEFNLVGVVENGLEMVEAARRLKPDVIVADISMPRLSGLDALEQLKREDPEVKVVFLTMHTEVAYARRALAAGAAGYVVKHSAAEELVMAVHAAQGGEVFISPSLAGRLARGGARRSTGEPAGALTPRQREILELMARGLSAKEIADVLSVSTRTVEFHKYQMMASCGVHSSAELILFAIKNGIVTV